MAKAQNWLKQSEQSHKQTAATSLHKAFIAASEEMNQLFDVFISYGRADSLDFAIKLHARLVEQGLNVWFDKEGIPLGVDYQKQIDDGTFHPLVGKSTLARESIPWLIAQVL